MRFSRFTRILLVLALSAVVLAAVGGLGGCSKKGQAAKAEPKVKPPAVAQAGVLTVAIDLTYPPFGGVDKDKQAGIDVDIAEALAASLGLDLKIVSLPATQALAALGSGSVDAVMSVPIAASTVTSTTIVGTYIADGPAFFTTAEETVTVQRIGTRPVAAQQGSQSFWLVADQLGPGVVQDFPTLRDAFGALADGKIGVVAGDAIVGAYIARDFPDIRFSGQLGLARPLAVAVAKDNDVLSTLLRASLDTLASDGVLKAVRAKWVGDIPELAVPRK